MGDTPDSQADQKSKGISWSTAPEIIKRGLPPPPMREEFTSQADYEEASSGWSHRFGRVMAIRYSALKPEFRNE